MTTHDNRNKPTKARTWRTDEETGERMEEPTALPCIHRYSRKDIDPDESQQLTNEQLERQGMDLSRIEAEFDKNLIDPWHLQYQLDRFRARRYHKPAAIDMGKPAAPITDELRDKAQDLKDRIRVLQMKLDRRKVSWTASDDKALRMRQRKLMKPSQPMTDEEESKEQLIAERKSKLRLNNPTIAAQWQTMRKQEWVKTPQGCEPWETEEWTVKGRGSDGKDRAKLAFAIGVIYAGDKITSDSYDWGKTTFQRGKAQINDILKEVAKLFQMAPRALIKARDRQTTGRKASKYIEIHRILAGATERKRD